MRARMAKVIPVTGDADPTLLGVAKKLATDMENGTRPFIRGFETDAGNIVFQRVGDQVRAIVSPGSSSSEYVGVSFTDVTKYDGDCFYLPNQFIMPVVDKNTFPVTQDGAQALQAYIAERAAPLFLQFITDTTAERRAKLYADSQQSISDLKSGILPPEWDFWLKQSAPVSKNVSRPVKMGATHSDEIVFETLGYNAANMPAPGDVRRIIIRRTVNFEYTNPSDEVKTAVEVGTYSITLASPTSWSFDNWYVPAGMSLAASVRDIFYLAGTFNTPSQHVVIGRAPADSMDGQRVSDTLAPNNYAATRMLNEWEMPHQFVMDNSSAKSIDLNFEYLNSLGAINSSARVFASYRNYFIEASGAYVDAPYQNVGMGLVWSGEVSGARSKLQYTANDFNPYLTVFKPLSENTFINTLRGTAPQIVLDYRGDIKPVYALGSGDNSWCDSAMFDGDTVQIIPFGLVTEGLPLGIYASPVDRTDSFQSGPIITTRLETDDGRGHLFFNHFLSAEMHFSSTGEGATIYQTGSKPDQIEVYGTANFKYNYDDGSFTFVKWIPLKDTKGNVVLSRRINITEVPSFNALVNYPVKWPDTKTEARRAKTTQSPLVTAILNALSPQ